MKQIRRHYLYRQPHQGFWRKKLAEVSQIDYDLTDDWIYRCYEEDLMSTEEIKERIQELCLVSPSVRSIQRIVWGQRASRGIIGLRNPKECFRLAIKRGRVNWTHQRSLKFYKRKSLGPNLRYQVLERDSFKCVLCGNTAKSSLLEIDHIKPVSNGGMTIIDNLRTLCWECNIGKSAS